VPVASASGLEASMLALECADFPSEFDLCFGAMVGSSVMAMDRCVILGRRASLLFSLHPSIDLSYFELAILSAGFCQCLGWFLWRAWQIWG